MPEARDWKFFDKSRRVGGVGFGFGCLGSGFGFSVFGFLYRLGKDLLLDTGVRRGHARVLIFLVFDGFFNVGLGWVLLMYSSCEKSNGILSCDGRLGTYQ